MTWRAADPVRARIGVDLDTGVKLVRTPDTDQSYIRLLRPRQSYSTSRFVSQVLEDYRSAPSVIPHPLS